MDATTSSCLASRHLHLCVATALDLEAVSFRNLSAIQLVSVLSTLIVVSRNYLGQLCSLMITYQLQ